MEVVVGVTSTNIKHAKTSAGTGALPVLIFATFPVLVFIAISFAMKSVFPTFGCFVLLFALIWALALKTGQYSVIAFSCILLALDPVPSVAGMSFAGAWLYFSLCVFILTGKGRMALSAVNWKMLALFVFPAFVSFLFSVAHNVSLLFEVGRLADIISPIVVGPVFFALTLRRPKEKLSTMFIIMLSVLVFYLLVFRFGVPKTTADEAVLKSGYAMAYLLGGHLIHTSRTGVGIVFSIICAASLVLIIEKKGSFLPHLSFFAGLLGIIWGGGRGVFVSLVLTNCMYLLLNLRRIGYYFVWVVVTGAVLIGMIAVIPQVGAAYNSWSGRWHLSRGETLEEGRAVRWMGAVEQIEREPLGMGKWTLALERGPGINYTHNDYLGFGISYGVVGCLAYVFAVLSAFVSLYRAFRANTVPLEKAIIGASLCAVCCLGINSFTDHLIADTGGYLLSWFIVGIGWSIADKRCRRTAGKYVS